MIPPRTIAFLIFFFVSFVIYQTWQNDHAPKLPVQSMTAAVNPTTDAHSDVPAANPVASTASSSSALPSDTAGTDAHTANNISITTDLLQLTVDTVGGDITDATLLKYPKELHSVNDYFHLLQQDATHTFIAQSGLIGANGIDTSAGRAILKAEKQSYTLTPGQTELRVPLTIEKDGVLYTKTFIFKPNSYAVDIEYTVDNKTTAPVTVEMYAQLKQTMLENTGSMAMPTYRGAAYSNDDKAYQKYPFTDMEKGKHKDQLFCMGCRYPENTPKSYTNQAWVGMLQHYFAVAWIPRSGHNFLYTATDKTANQARIGVQLNPLVVAAGTIGTTKASLWIGPKLQSAMAQVAQHLTKVWIMAISGLLQNMFICSSFGSMHTLCRIGVLLLFC